MKRLLAGPMSVALLFLIASALAAPPPPVGTWAQLPNTQLYPAIPPEAKSVSVPGGTPELWSPQGLFAFSGADVAQINGIWGFLIWGGGHGDSPDNSLYWDPFDGSGPKRLMGPYLAPDKIYRYDVPTETYRSVSRNAPSTVTSAGAPKSRHTYSSLLRIDLHGRPAVFCYGGSLYVGSGSGTAATRIFDLPQSYAEAMARPDMGWALKAPAPGSAVSSSSGWDPVQKRVVVRSRSFIGAYYPDTDRWENWHIQAAPFGSDFQASVAMDVAGRKMYVLGDRLAEVIDLDSKAYTDLRRKPWAARFVTGRYLAGPGVSWHARTKQIVAWVGGNDLLLINPVTDTLKTATMGGATVSAAPSAGTYGRFRVIPGTDQVVLVNAVDQDVFIGTVPFDGGTPVPLARPTATSTPTAPPEPSTTLPRGSPDAVDRAGEATGWAGGGGRPRTSSQVVLGVAGEDLATVTPAAPRAEGVPANHGYRDRLPATFRDGRPGAVQLSALGTDDKTPVELVGLPMPFPLAGPTPAASPSTSAPHPSPGTVAVPPGQSLPARTWVERLMPTGTIQSYMQTGGKHGRTFYHPSLKQMVFAGGDWYPSSSPGELIDGAGAEIWALRVAVDAWTMFRPYCVPGAKQPGRPDTVTWALDRARNRALMAPGFYFLTQGASSGCGAIEGLGGYAFDFASKTYIGPDDPSIMGPPPNGWGGDTDASFGIIDPTADELIRFRNGPRMERMNLATRRWRVQTLVRSDIGREWNPVPNRSQPVLDDAGRAAYWLDVWSTRRALIKVELATGAITPYPLPIQYTPPSAADHEIYLVFDTKHRKVLVPNTQGMGDSPVLGLGIFDVETHVWEWEAVPSAVWGSVWGFDEATGAIIGIGKRSPPHAYFLYKYAATAPPTR